MKYSISRTSGGTNPPCEGAVMGFYDREIKFVKGMYSPNEWNSSGKNHREEIDSTGRIIMCKEIEIECWFIELNSLNELNEISEKHGDIIISKDDVWKIEIYDDYRE